MIACLYPTIGQVVSPPFKVSRDRLHLCLKINEWSKSAWYQDQDNKLTWGFIPTGQQDKGGLKLQVTRQPFNHVIIQAACANILWNKVSPRFDKQPSTYIMSISHSIPFERCNVAVAAVTYNRKHDHISTFCLITPPESKAETTEAMFGWDQAWILVSPNTDITAQQQKNEAPCEVYI